MDIQWNPDFTNSQGNRKLVRKIGEFEKWGGGGGGVKLQCSIEEGKRLLVRVNREVRKIESSRNRDFTVKHLMRFQSENKDFKFLWCDACGGD